MTIAPDRRVEITVTAANAAEYLQEGFRFAENVPVERLEERLDYYTAQFGFGAVLIGKVARLCTGLPWDDHHDGSHFSIFVRRPCLPSQRSR